MVVVCDGRLLISDFCALICTGEEHPRRLAMKTMSAENGGMSLRFFMDYI